jgi:hypothetical protein
MLARDQWIKSLRLSIKACNPGLKSDNILNTDKYSSSFFETILSQVHINDNSLQNQLSALASLDEMFKSEL